MKNMKKVKRTALFSLFLILQMSLSSNTLFLPVQAQSTSPDLEASEWQVTIKDFYNFDTIIYRFDDKGKVELLVARIVARVLPPRPTRDPLDIENIPMLQKGHFQGTFKRDGNSIRIEFSDHTIVATIKGTHMEGKARDKETGRTASWAADMVSNDDSNTEDSANPKDLLGKADELMKKGKYLEAIESYTAALQLNLSKEEKLVAFGNRGNARIELKDYRRAKEDYEQFFGLYNSDNLAGLEPLPIIDKEILINVYNGEGVAEYMIGDRYDACYFLNRACSEANDSNSGNKIGCENVKKFCRKN